MSDNRSQRPELGLTSEIYAAAGATAQVLPILTGALAIGEQTSERFREAELRRLQGEALLVDDQSSLAGGAAEAELCFRRAIEIAHSQQAKALELRAATSLARLWRDQGKRADARALLGSVYGWFTEGFDTRDLIEAKALLDEL